MEINSLFDFLNYDNILTIVTLVGGIECFLLKKQNYALLRLKR